MPASEQGLTPGTISSDIRALGGNAPGKLYPDPQPLTFS